MQNPLQITFRDIDVSDALEAACHAEAAKLERHYDRITSCRVTISAPHRIHIHAVVPGGEIVVNREPSLTQKDEDFHEAMRDAFDIALRRLDDFVARRRDRIVRPSEEQNLAN